jgi:ankyrin repeat protein
MPSDGFLPIPQSMVLARLADTVYPSMFDFNAQHMLAAMGTSDQVILHQILTSLAFKITDGRASKIRDFVAFGIVLRQLRYDIFSKIVRGGSAVLKAVWDRFAQTMFALTDTPMDQFQRQQGPDFDLATMNNACAGIVHAISDTHPDWIETWKNQLLHASAWLGSRELVVYLLSRGARACCSKPTTTTTLVCATEAGIIDVVEPLIATVDMNACTTVANVRQHLATTSHFVLFLLHFLVRPGRCAASKKSRPHFLLSLTILLQAGANVDAVFPIELCSIGRPRSLRNLAGDLRLSCLDIAFYCDHQAFNMMAKYTSRGKDVLTRDGLCGATTAGIAAVDEYMRSRKLYDIAQRRRFLEVVLLEQALLVRHNRHANLDTERTRIFRVLHEYGLNIGLDGYDADAGVAILEVWLSSVKEYGLRDDLREAVALLGHRSLPIDERILARCIEEKGTSVLAFLERKSLINKADVAGHGTDALAAAARLNNFEAVSWLLKRGADVNAETGPRGREFSVIGACFLYRSPIKTCRRLHQLGAKLRRRSSERTCAQLLATSLSSVGFWRKADLDEVMLERWHFFKEFPAELDRLCSAEWKEVARRVFDRMASREPSRIVAPILDEILERSAMPNGIPSLVLAIRAERYPIVQALLASGSAVDESDNTFTPLGTAITKCNFRLARQIIELGADIDIIFSNGIGSIHCSNALGEACFQSGSSRRERGDCLDVIRLLLSKGADVNDSHVQPYRRPWFHAPLLNCAVTGSLEATTLLLQNGANPNIIMVWSAKRVQARFSQLREHLVMVPLDVSVEMDRLDMTQLLLKVGAFSSNPGRTGYDGAISIAINRGHRALADVIRQHMCDLEVLFNEKPSLRQGHQHRIDAVQREVDEMIRRAKAGEVLLNEQPEDDW